MVLITSVLRGIPVQRNGPCVLSVSLVLKPKNWRAVLEGLIKIGECQPVAGFVGVQEAGAEIEGSLNFPPIVSVIEELGSIPVPAPGGASGNCIGLHRHTSGRESEQHFSRTSIPGITISCHGSGIVPGQALVW